MKDYNNDFFEDFIDVDDEADAEAPGLLAEADDDSDEEYDEDDDNSSVVRTAVLTKNEMLALLSLKAGPEGGQIVRYDPREPVPTMQRYETERDAARWFTRSLATSRKNGWTIVYDGEPNVG